AQDAAGHLAVAVSTSGWAFKYPGRLGDSPIVGAGNYCDDRYGAAACIGVGEWTIRCGTARSIVLYMKLGYSLQEACQEAVRDLASLERWPVHGAVSILALDREGRHRSVTTHDRPSVYTLWEEGMDGPETRQAAYVPMS
ncbi:MAG: isoaspartyl peptidase/L-asparaginase, partial [Anaerolineae bacterium]|nr:isoaspartyl peptidase/L-asparaginase [Anaerolineae bacterium]